MKQFDTKILCTASGIVIHKKSLLNTFVANFLWKHTHFRETNTTGL